MKAHGSVTATLRATLPLPLPCVTKLCAARGNRPAFRLQSNHRPGHLPEQP